MGIFADAGTSFHARGLAGVSSSPSATASSTPAAVSPSSTPSPPATPTSSPSPAATVSPTATPAPFYCPGEVFAVGYASTGAAQAAQADASLVRSVTAIQSARKYSTIIDDNACLARRNASLVPWSTLAATDPAYSHHSDAMSGWSARAPSAAGLGSAETWRRVASCSGHGSCQRDSKSSTGGSCSCTWGYTGASCSQCAPGFHSKQVCASCSTTLPRHVAGMLGTAVASVSNTTVGAVWAVWLRSVRLQLQDGNITVRVPASDAQCTGGGAPAAFDVTCDGSDVTNTVPSMPTNCSAPVQVLASVACALPSPALAAAAPWWWHGAGKHNAAGGDLGSVNGNGVCSAEDGSGVCSAGHVDAVSGAVTCPSGFSACSGDPVFTAGTPHHSVQTCVPCGGSRLVAVADSAAQTSATASTAATVFAGAVCSGHGTCLAAEGGVWPPESPQESLGSSHLGSNAAVRAYFDSLTVTEAKLFERTASLNLTAANAAAPQRTAAKELFQQAAAAAVPQGSAAFSWAAASGSGAMVVYPPSAIAGSRGVTSFLRDYVAPLSLQWLAPFVNSHAVIGGGRCVCSPGWAGPDCGVHVASSAQVDNGVVMQAGKGGALAVNSTDASGVDSFVPLVAMAACAGDSTCSGHGICRHRKEYQQYRLFSTLPAKQNTIGIESAFNTFLNPDVSRFWPSSILQCTCVAGWTGDRCHIAVSPSTVADGAAPTPLSASVLQGGQAVSRWEADPLWAQCSAQCNSGSTFRSTACHARSMSIMHQGTAAALCESTLYDGPTRGSDVATSSDLLAEVYATASEAGAPPQLLPPAAAVNGSCSRFVRPSISRSCRTTACGTSVASLTLPLASVSQPVVDAVLLRAGRLTGAAGALVLSAQQRYGEAYSFSRVTGGAGAGINSAVHMWDDGAVAEAFVTAVAVDVAAALGISVTRIQVLGVVDKNLDGTASAPGATCGSLGSQATCAAGVDVQLEVVDGRTSGEAASPDAMQSLVAAAKSGDSVLRAGVQALFSVAASVRDRAPAGSGRMRLRTLQASAVDSAGIPRLSAAAGQVDEQAVAASGFGSSSQATSDIRGESNDTESTFTIWEIIGILVAVLVGTLILGCGMYYCWLYSVRSDPKNRGKYQAIKARAARDKQLLAAEKQRAAKRKVAAAGDTEKSAVGATPVSIAAVNEDGPPGGARVLGRRGRPPLAPAGDSASAGEHSSPSPVLHDLGDSSQETAPRDAFRLSEAADADAGTASALHFTAPSFAKDETEQVTENALGTAKEQSTPNFEKPQGGSAASGGMQALKRHTSSGEEARETAMFALSPDSPQRAEGRQTPVAEGQSALLQGGAEHSGEGSGLDENAPLSPGGDGPDMVASMFESLAADGADAAAGGHDADDSSDSDQDTSGSEHQNERTRGDGSISASPEDESETARLTAE